MQLLSTVTVPLPNAQLCALHYYLQKTALNVKQGNYALDLSPRCAAQCYTTAGTIEESHWEGLPVVFCAHT